MTARTCSTLGARRARSFAPERADTAINVFESVVAHVLALQAQRKKVVIALWSEGSRDRMGSMLPTTSCSTSPSVNTWRTVQATPRNEAMLAVVGMESGFETADVAVISEQESSATPGAAQRKSSRKLDNFISEVTSLACRRSGRACRARHRPLHRPADAGSLRRAA